MTSSGSALSAKAVKPRRSQNTIVTSRRWLWRGSCPSGAETRRSATCRRQEPAKAAHPLDLGDLLGDPRLQRGVPGRELAGLPLQRRRLLPHGVVERLHAEHGAHPRQKGRVVERLRQVVVRPGVQAADDVARVGPRGHQDDRDEGQSPVALDRPHDRDPVQLRHHDVEEDQVGFQLARERQALLAVCRRRDGVVLRLEAQAQDVQVLRRVVDREDQGRLAHGRALQARKPLTAARSWRGLKGLAM